MNKLYCLLILFLTGNICTAQNLVPNGNFEQFTNCPQNFSDFMGFVSNWINPHTGLSNGTPDYFNQCSSNCGVPSNVRGWQNAVSGVAYCGLVIAREMSNQNFREYPEIMLTSPLVANACYHFEMYMSLGDQSQYTSDNIGVYFSTTPITGISTVGPLPFTPQIINATGNYPDTATWIKVMGNYVANGNENYILIGNFNDSTNTNMVLVNSASTFPVAFVFIDSVSLTSCTTGLNDEQGNVSISLFPNPVSDQLHVSSDNNEYCEIILYDMQSRKILQQEFINSTEVDVERLADGIYFIRFETGLRTVTRKIVICH